MAGKLYTVIEDQGVTETLYAAVQSDRRVEDVFDGLVWRIARDPGCGTEVENQGINYRLVKSLPLKRIESPFILMRYRVDEEQGEIVVDWIKVFPYDPALAHSPREFELD